MCYPEMIVDEYYTVMVCECYIGIPVNVCTVMCIVFIYMLSTLMSTIGKFSLHTQWFNPDLIHARYCYTNFPNALKHMESQFKLKVA